MIAAILLAAALPLGLWPTTSGDAAAEKNGVEFYVVEPADDYWIIAVQPLNPPLARPEAAALKRLAATADVLGADAVLLLEEMPPDSIPKDPEAPLAGTGHFAEAVFVTFDCGCDDSSPPPAVRGRLRIHVRHDGGRAIGAALHRARPARPCRSAP